MMLKVQVEDYHVLLVQVKKLYRIIHLQSSNALL